MRYYAVKLGHVWRLHKAESPEVACEFLFGIPLAAHVKWRDLGTRKAEALKQWRALTT